MTSRFTRRELLAARAGVGAALVAPGVACAGSSAAPAASHPMRGVNLGGWLVLEKWICAAPFAGTDAGDEYSLCQALGPAKASDRLRRHREAWITADDFKWLAAHGIDSVRLPVGYWVAEDDPPFVSAWDTVEWAFRTARANGLRVLLDLHGAPGSQNGFDHSGRAGKVGWHTDPANVAHTLRVIEDLAARCAAFDNLIGIELLNEPRWDVPIEALKSYYREGYARVRKHLPAARSAVVIHDGFRPMEWSGFLQPPEFENVILDTHLYQCFTDADHKRPMDAQIALAAVDRRKRLADMSRELPTIVGEWSCGIPPESLGGLDPFASDTAMRAFGAAQLVSYEATRGWFFWTYKIENGGGWSFRDCVARGWMPDRYAAA